MAKQKLGLLKNFGFIFASLFFSFSCQSAPKNTESPVPVKVDAVQPVPFQEKGTEKSALAFDVTLSSSKVPDGSIVSVGLHPLMEIDVAGVKVNFEGKEYPVFQGGPGRDLESLIVVPFNSKPRMTKINLVWQGGKAEIPIEVVDGNYPKEALTVAKDKANPPKRVMARIRREQKKIGKLYKQVTPERMWSGPFILPIDSEVTSKFGNKRMYNGALARFHQGLDLRARTPLPIKAPEGARVALAEDLYFTGNTVILDHGYGLFTIYAHMSKLDVKVGDRVAKSQVLGLSGMTGRVSGPHLHWGAVLLHEKFNPSDLTQVPR
jgi:hypothetical protein